MKLVLVAMYQTRCSQEICIRGERGMRTSEVGFDHHGLFLIWISGYFEWWHVNEYCVVTVNVRRACNICYWPLDKGMNGYVGERGLVVKVI